MVKLCKRCNTREAPWSSDYCERCQNAIDRANW